MLICALVLHNDCKLWKVIQRLLSLGGRANYWTRLGVIWTGQGLDWMCYKELSPMSILEQGRSLFGSASFVLFATLQNSTRLCFSYAFLLLLFPLYFFFLSWCFVFFSLCEFCSFRRRFLVCFVVELFVFFTPLLTCLTLALPCVVGLPCSSATLLIPCSDEIRLSGVC